MEHSVEFPGDNNKVAILFGPERSGLSNEEIALADAVITIPVSELNPSLNLAQSSVVLGYEWFSQMTGGASRPSESSTAEGGSSTSSSHHGRGEGEPGDIKKAATKQEIEGLLGHLKPLLDDVNYFREPNRMESMWLTLRNIFFSKKYTSQEVQTLRGVLRSIQRKL